MRDAEAVCWVCGVIFGPWLSSGVRISTGGVVGGSGKDDPLLSGGEDIV